MGKCCRVWTPAYASCQFHRCRRLLNIRSEAQHLFFCFININNFSSHHSILTIVADQDSVNQLKMKFSHQAAAVLSLLARDAFAQAVTCQTALGTSSLKVVPTTTSTTIPPSSTTTVTLSPTSTVLQGLTSTSTVFFTLITKTTTTPATDVVTSTSVVYETSTESDTTTISTTSTEIDTTSSTTTYFSQTTPGFQPIGDTLNQNTFPQKRDLGHPHQVRAVTTGTVGVQKLLATSYPTKVICRF